jgi:hypothetical protein
VALGMAAIITALAIFSFRKDRGRVLFSIASIFSLILLFITIILDYTVVIPSTATSFVQLETDSNLVEIGLLIAIVVFAIGGFIQLAS